MKSIFTGCIAIISIGLLSNCSSDDTQTVTTFDTLIIEDNFDIDGAPDPNLWGFDIGDGSDQGLDRWGNNELQYYTDRTENVKVENGFLLITARQEDFQGSNYTSARLVTKGKFDQKYGRFEARMRLPYGRGMWPAFWMLGDDNDGVDVWPQIGEIDIMENRGQEPTIITGSVHGPGYSAGNAVSKSFILDGARFDTDFHVFGIEWGPNYINYYVDNKLYNQITPADVDGEWVFNDRPFYMLLNLAIGGSYVGNPNDETNFPQTMLVDYVRVYQK
ncbi:glycoside hydrolase family 16 protein [Subsaximicrobium wynnwilliamsii]|uniref:Glycoside hydrolase family 16 protein n=1 Tax=Subsaximicrobium wynnwilliamsii TaxID=291179 RepID=A0A5C6ZCY6_9FLAO|nr:glycoside hydrolase family 16 protein [Subsaximicrobium wynnwilliamsii]TXD81968.1 glycoside hydrolase family 16 protein [Subsaximicrobium wynnwilliamsii]TXD87666.1 glycoside hydrolase family 16 protein [Subsaximicrobium wynnwilliamsii]TXE01431.1 glycoside hydrolase family 16 protein [Subsaximicrobium wynnwilliamsii]